MRYRTLKAFGVETQAPQWALTLLSLILVAGIGWMVYAKVYADPELVIVSLKDANKQLNEEVEEYSQHAMEDPQKHELFEDQDGKLILRVFKDHCVLIQRQTSKGTRTKLVMDLARGMKMISTAAAPTLELQLLPVVYAAESQTGCQRGCANPHPGQFTWRYGQQYVNGWVELWRRWPEGCTHVQLFHPKTGAWDSNPDGTARVRWTCCVH